MEKRNFALVIELERHIEILLLDNDCVIVPGLGGFVAHHVDARFDSRDNMFLPPMRTLGFNPKLDMNDSLLAQSYVEAYDISYPEALGRIDSEVDELRQTLERDGFYELSDIGVLSINAEGKYEFEPCESGILTPDLYGLAGFQMKPLSAGDVVGAKPVVVEMPVRQTTRQTTKNTENVAAGRADSRQESGVLPFGESKLAEQMSADEAEEERTISIKVSVLRNVVAVACAIVAFFVMATPISTDVYENGRKVSSMNYSLLYNLVPVDGSKAVRQNTPIYKKVEKADKPHAVAPKAEVETKKPSAGELRQERAADYYSIVLACRITKANAEAFVKKLHAEGYEEARLVGGEDSSLKVVYGEYPTESKAYSKLNEMRSDDLFKESWIYHVK